MAAQLALAELPLRHVLDEAVEALVRLLRDQDIARKLRASRDAPAIYSVLALPPARAA